MLIFFHGIFLREVFFKEFMGLFLAIWSQSIHYTTLSKSHINIWLIFQKSEHFTYAQEKVQILFLQNKTFPESHNLGVIPLIARTWNAFC